MTPKKGQTFHRGVRRFVHGDKISEAYLKDENGKIMKLPSLEKWTELSEEKIEAEKTGDQNFGDPVL